MWLNLLINIIISCIIIVVGHHLWIYFKEKYSVKKTKDMVGSQIQKYKNLLETIQQESLSHQKNQPHNGQGPCHITILDNPAPVAPPIVLDGLDGMDVDDIKQDLELFLQEIPT
jgi:hypothetical protein